MKKILFLSFLILSGVVTQIFADHCDMEDARFDVALTAGYVFKNDHRFKEVYGHGMVNIITADGCYYPCRYGGVGAKLSYWRATGETTFLGLHTLAQEVPLIFYLRGKKDFRCNVRLYGSLGGGFAWIQEKSYLGKVRTYKGLGELEVGLNYSMCGWANITTAIRYLFPPQSRRGEKIDVGGVDLRAGIGFSF